MSLNALEKALWQAYAIRDDCQRYLTERDTYLDGFDLDERERRMLLDVDVVGQIEYGANSMLVMMVWQAVNGIENLGDYFALVNAPPAH